jgi:N-acetylglucosamine-6-phosphate deacetylase
MDELTTELIADGHHLPPSLMKLVLHSKGMVNFVDLSIREAVQMATCNTAKIQGLDNDLGVLAKNKKADITVFDDNIDVKMTIVDGEIRHNVFSK